MKKFKCCECGKVCYSASKEGASCPYCGGKVKEIKREGGKQGNEI